MADAAPVGGSGGQVPQTFGQKIVFGIPAIIVALVLAVGISFGILSAVVSGAKDDLTKAYKGDLAESERKAGEKVKELETANASLKTDLQGLVKATKELEEARQVAATKLEEFSKTAVKLAEFKSFEEGQKALDSTQNKDITATAQAVSELDRKVVYIQDKLKKLDDLATEVNGLKGDTNELKGQYATLKTDMTKVTKQADITEKDLADLSERARLFQLRVLAARAREAADAARQLNLKDLLNRLDDVEDGK